MGSVSLGCGSTESARPREAASAARAVASRNVTEPWNVSLGALGVLVDAQVTVAAKCRNHLDSLRGTRIRLELELTEQRVDGSTVFFGTYVVPSLAEADVATLENGPDDRALVNIALVPMRMKNTIIIPRRRQRSASQPAGSAKAPKATNPGVA